MNSTQEFIASLMAVVIVLVFIGLGLGLFLKAMLWAGAQVLS